MVRWVVESILHGGPIELFFVPASAPRLANKGRGMCYPVCGKNHINEPLLLIGKSSYVVKAGFLSRYLSGPLSCGRKCFI